jgi:hypothetical protein
MMQHNLLYLEAQVKHERLLLEDLKNEENE